MGYYDFNGSSWTVSSTSDGFAFTPDDITVEMIGGNDGSGLPGTTTALVTAPAAGTVQFDYTYNSLDVPDADTAGYVLNGSFNQFATTDGQTGTITFSVNSGDSFGFEVWTMDNLGEPGILQVTNFNAPDGASSNGSVPEPQTWQLALLAAAVTAVYFKVKRSRKCERQA
jgi:hypothetical protein